MSMHKIPLTDIERTGLLKHGLTVDKPSQLSDGFRQGVAHGLLHSATHITELEALCLNALYHHQGGSSPVGQPIRKALGIGKYNSLTEAQLKIIQSVRAPYVMQPKEQAL